ncbi:ATP-binding cassette domain-containing protein [Paenibacillus sp. ACRSA]|uniref:ABC transporter ATP-binding protein/permease n=1 Tax=Paenibacillus sp. ACRSA TaxID=2918211 RepID=UPI001EF64014|nr:ABC transporter ATP-binding protein/permease [Paenibacillus sp. ACRSA]MCG7378804.1 ATP-binding cassette domain-containing protein [Paenibacillus sp. ACRSA]
MKLKLLDIKKTYTSGEHVTAVKGVTVGFRQHELVSILGPSGCGKTSLLNMIGGLDQYESGDLLINGISTTKYKEQDWDAYRNHSIGFVFQSYNLIGHQTILQNVEIAMTLSGVKPAERKRRAKQALSEVGLSKHIKKKPNQLSGGQMQRVAIARALVNNPDIILADEPTGALDSHTSDQIMDILKAVSETRLVIMVTHNAEQADTYSDRIIRMLDGQIVSDSDPLHEDVFIEETTPKADKIKISKTSMSMQSALMLSFRNLLTKRGRTLTTAFAGSIGIIGVALVLALSNGLSTYLDSMQSSTLSGLPINITAGTVEGTGESSSTTTNLSEYPTQNVIYPFRSDADNQKHTNKITDPFLNYIEEMKTDLPNSVSNITFNYGLHLNLLAKGQDTVVDFNKAGDFNGKSYWQQLPENQDLILSQYDLIGEGSQLPTQMNEVALVVDKYNRLEKDFFEKIGISDVKSNYSLTDFIGKTVLKVIPNNLFYTRKSNDLFVAAAPDDYSKLYNNPSGTSLKITGILRPKDEANGSLLNEGFAYSSKLTKAMLEDSQQSTIAKTQAKSDLDVLSSTPFVDEKARERAEILLGVMTKPIGIDIFPKDFEGKEQIKGYLDQYNDERSDTDKIIYSDFAEGITSITKKLLDGITYVLTGFAGISLFVSTVMIGIITYVSVIERTKEIGILRSVGARKRDISRVFNAETIIVGLAAGMLGVGITYVITYPVNLLIRKFADISNIANLSPVHAIYLILGSTLLTLIAGVFPSRMAAAKDPVEALRNE